MTSNDEESIGPYVFQGVIGEGAFSVVRLAQHRTTKEYVAIKIVEAARINSPRLLGRFESEIRITHRMLHPGIVRFIDFFREQKKYYVVMELCPNGEFYQLIVDNGKISEKKAKVFFRQLLEALRYIHSLGIVHRDLKPENLLLDQSGHLRISDFGLANFVDRNSLVSTPCGSPCYASPECISGLPYNGYTSDVWSLGVVFYAAITGRLPWSKKSQNGLFKQIRKGEYAISRKVSEEASSLIKGMMCVDTTQRLTIDQCLAHPFLSSVPVQYSLSNQSLHQVSLKKIDDVFCPDRRLHYHLKKRSKSMSNFDLTTLVKLIGKKKRKKHHHHRKSRSRRSEKASVEP